MVLVPLRDRIDVVYWGIYLMFHCQVMLECCMPVCQGHLFHSVVVCVSVSFEQLGVSFRRRFIDVTKSCWCRGSRQVVCSVLQAWGGRMASYEYRQVIKSSVSEGAVRGVLLDVNWSSLAFHVPEVNNSMATKLCLPRSVRSQWRWKIRGHPSLAI